MRFSDTLLDEIRARLPISGVVGGHVVWDRRKSQPARGDHWACCPFHNEKSPSFHADDRRGRYYCFGCGASGDHFRFLTEKAGLSFPEAVERLAQEAGVPLPKPDPAMAAREDTRDRLARALALAAEYFEDELQKADGAAARGYLMDRGLSARTIGEFRLGFAPNDRHGLKNHLAAHDIKLSETNDAGLVITPEDGSAPFDRFRDRIMFPILGGRDRVIAFGGRAMSGDAKAKYLNSPETELFSKRRVLYNLARARNRAHETGTLIAAEGYMDVIALSAAGFANAVAPLGTALTSEQLAMMWRMVDEPVLCFDGDEAGLRAAYRALDLALPHLTPGKSLRFAMLPGGKDPDDLVREEGAEAFAQIVDAARPMAEMAWLREVEGKDFSTPERRAALDRRMRDLVDEINDESVRGHYRENFSERLRSFWHGGERKVGGSGAGFRKGPQAYGRGRYGDAVRRRNFPAAATSALKSSALARSGAREGADRERLLVLAMVNHPELLERYPEEFSNIELTSPALDSIRREILDIAARVAPLDRAGLLAQLTNRGVIGIVERLESGLTHKSDWFVLPDSAAIDAETGWLHTLSLHRKSSSLNKELRAAERAYADEESEESFARLRDIRQALSSAEGSEAAIEGFGEASNRAAGHDR